jgi:hypothetical protein
MTDWKPLFGRNDNTFGLGLFKQTVGGETVIGFSGGTLGTSSATWYHVGTGAIVSVTATVDGADSGGSTHEISAWLKDIDTWAPVADDGGPLEIRSVCAADLTVAIMADGLCFSAHQAAVTLDLALRGLAADATVFEDGSVLIVGD